ncbi:retron system putative HNH endonuclease [Candidatus Halobeggiatoa sp. HSG11]|nr:retron system putative HNH endonuclease [Candidatus Halobeggiatoa sp. HSG11]
MIELKHDDPPHKLEQRKNNPNDNGTPENPRKAWSNFYRNNGKQEIHEKLIPLQGDLCVYCENKLDKHGFHIEHILSKTQNPLLTFEYSNLSLSCVSDEKKFKDKEIDDNSISCGHAPLKKTNTYNENLFIKPTEANCNSLFSYEINGKIGSNNNNSEFDKQRVEHTLEVLNLNCYRLIREREEIILQGYEIIKELQGEPELLNHFFELEFEKVNSKYLFPFVNARKEHYSLFKK